MGKGGSGPSESDLAKYQNWRTALFGASDAFTICGTVGVRLHATIKDFQFDKAGEIKVFLRDYDGSTYTEIANATFLESDFQGGFPSFNEKSIEIADVNHLLDTGHALELKVLVGDNSADSLWFAYDTNDEDSTAIVPKLTDPTYSL